MIKPAKNVVADAIRKGERLPELLAPAGSYTALMAAIEGGADAVYMGGVAFNARINAKNFSDEELRRGISLAHSYGVKIYIAANTLIYDRELDGFLRAAEYAYTCGADALIIADVGAACEVSKRIPIELHASTQYSGHGADAAKLLENSGFSRMVCAREMSREDIESFIDVSPLEAEVFVHGALCVCHSGQCLFSSLVGGRSGNRGECAQPCRLPYGERGKTKEYPLSLKDLTLATHIPELCDMGVSSLKIEGRMKSPEYVRDVTAIWRRLLDERKRASATDIKELEDIFSRGGFTNGYFTKTVGKGMLGVRSEEQKKISRELAPFEKITKKIPVDMRVTVRAQEPVLLTMKRLDNGKSVSVTGDVPQMARTAPIDEATVRRSLCKLGDTPYTVKNMDVTVDGGLMLPVSALNALRRSAVECLGQEQNEKAKVAVASPKSAPCHKPTKMATAMFFEPQNIPPSAYSCFDIIYTPLEKYTGNSNGVAIPPVVFDSEREKVERMLSDAVSMGARHVLVGNFGHLEMVRRAGLAVHGDFRLNICNNSSVAVTEDLGLEDVILSPELTLSQIRDIGGRTSVCVYGRIPLMVTEKCVGKELGDCKNCKEGKTKLTDRRGVSFPVLRTFEHRSIIINSVPLYMADKQSELLRAGINMRHFIFTTESKSEADEVIRAYECDRPAKDLSKIKRIK